MPSFEQPAACTQLMVCRLLLVSWHQPKLVCQCTERLPSCSPTGQQRMLLLSRSLHLRPRHATARRRVWDNDGEFLLIEAAYGLPRWLKPETAQNRVWLHGGAFHLVPLPRFKGEDCPTRSRGGGG